jgi:hypothetical protein
MEADLQYLEYARKLTLYGVDLHEARVISYLPLFPLFAWNETHLNSTNRRIY